MANTSSLSRMEINLIEGVNTLVSPTLSKKGELDFALNARCKIIGTIEKRQGTKRLGNQITATANYGLFYFENSTATSTGFFRISTVSATTTVYYLNTSATWTALTGGGTGLTAANFVHTIAEKCCFLVNGTDANRYIGSDGTTVTTSSTATGHLYNSPIAYLINYYKDRLYLGDYTNTTRYKNGIMMSSMPLGIVALVDGDHAAADCEADDWIKVTDTKYIYATDTLDVYRGNVKIADFTVKAKTEDTIQINAITFAGSYTTLDSSDEIWVDGTFTGTKVFRWAGNPASGINVKQYDTFNISGSQNDSLTMMANIGNVMMIANKYNLAVWDDSAVTNLDLGIGCTSKRGWVKTSSGLFFLAYDGIYKTTGGVPELISSKVELYISGATKAGKEAAAMGYKGKSIFCYIGTVTLYNPDGSTKKTLSDVVLEYNLRTTNWYVHTGIKATQFATYVASLDTDRLEFSSTESGYQIIELFYDATTDDKITSTQEVPFRIDTGNLYLSKNFENFVYPVQIIAETDRGSGLSCFVSLDDGDFYELTGNLVKGITIIKVQSRDKNVGIPPRCRKINISFRDNSQQFCKISRFTIVYSLTGEEDEKTAKKY